MRMTPRFLSGKQNRRQKKSVWKQVKGVSLDITHLFCPFSIAAHLSTHPSWKAAGDTPSVLSEPANVHTPHLIDLLDGFPESPGRHSQSMSTGSAHTSL